MVVRQNYLGDRVGKLAVLVVITVIVQIIYASYVRPTAEAWLTEQRAIAAQNPGYTPERSIWVIIQDPEQQATIIISHLGDVPVRHALPRDQGPARAAWRPVTSRRKPAW